MPLLQVHTSRTLARSAKDALGASLARAYGEEMQTNAQIVTVGFVAYAADDLVRYDGEAEAPGEMAVVTADIRVGRTPEVQEALGRALTDLVATALGIAPARVAVYLTEHVAHQIHRDGGRAPDWSAEESLNRR